MDDPAFKKLFSHPRMIELLIRRHVPEWHREIEYSSLERLPTELIDERLRRRYPDMIWRARTIDGTTDLVLLLELQGRPERHMVLRTTTYSVLAVHDTRGRAGQSIMSSIHVVASMNRPGRYQPERQLLGGVRTHQESAPFHGALSTTHDIV